MRESAQAVVLTNYAVCKAEFCFLITLFLCFYLGSDGFQSHVLVLRALGSRPQSAELPFEPSRVQALEAGRERRNGQRGMRM